MHRYSLIKLICRDSLLWSVLNSFVPSYQSTCTLTLVPLCSRWQFCNQPKCHAVCKMLLLIISWSHQSSCFPSSTTALWLVTPNSDDSTTNSHPKCPGVTPRGGWSRGNCHRLLFICQLKWKQLDGDILTAQQRSYFFKVATANHRKLERAHRHSLYSSSGASESNLLLQDNRKSEATVGFLSLDFSPLFTCLSTSLSFPRCSRPGSEGFNFLPATKLHCNYTPYFIVLDVDNSLCA